METSGIEDASFENVAVGESHFAPVGGRDFASVLIEEDRREDINNFASPHLGEPHAKTELEVEVAAFGDPALAGISDEELNQQCVELFASTPIKFLPRSGNELDVAIAASIDELKLTIPVQWI